MNPPIYTVSVPEYQVKTFENTETKQAYRGTPWHNIQIPTVYWENKPDFALIGRKIDPILKTHFNGNEVAIRCLSSTEHPEKSIDELVEIILQIGHDRYDPNRKGDRYENLENKQIDFFAIPFKIDEDSAYFEHFIEPFYFWPVSDRGKPIRIDLAIIYDLNQLSVVEHRYSGRENEIKRDGFVFNHPERKLEAILGLIKILS